MTPLLDLAQDNDVPDLSLEELNNGLEENKKLLGLEEKAKSDAVTLLRIFRNTEDINWVKPVHEVIDGAKTYSHLPPHEELTLKHEKEIQRQEIQNKLYDQIL